MAKVTRFQDLIAWQRARRLSRDVYLASQSGKFARDFRLASQIQAAAVSSMSNIAEGYESGTSRKFARFLDDAKGSNAEVRSQLYTCLDVGYLSEEQFNDLMGLAEEVARLTGALRRAIQRRLGEDDA